MLSYTSFGGNALDADRMFTCTNPLAQPVPVQDQVAMTSTPDNMLLPPGDGYFMPQVVVPGGCRSSACS